MVRDTTDGCIVVVRFAHIFVISLRNSELPPGAPSTEWMNRATLHPVTYIRLVPLHHAFGLECLCTVRALC